MTTFTPTRPVTLKTKNGPRTFHPGEVVKVDPVKAAPFVESGVLRPVDPSAADSEKMSPPVLPDWVVAYRGRSGLIESGTVAEAVPSGTGWRFRLVSGIDLSESQILSVGEVEGGKLVGAWSVREHGLTGSVNQSAGLSVKPVSRPVDFEAMKWDLWPKLAHCAWGKLTDEEKDRWEVAILIQGEAEKESNTEKWQKMADILLEIAEAVATRRRESEHVE